MPPISLYIHIPFCSGKCPYCGFYSKPIAGFDTARYISAVITEINSQQICERDVRTIYLGGGTPTTLPEQQLMRLIDFLCRRFTVVEEFTIETNPSTPNNRSREIFSHGINRVSIGVQSLCDKTLRFLGRRYGSGDIPAAIDTIASHGISNIAIDLMFAIQGCDMPQWLQTLRQAAAMPVRHISAYSLSFDEGTRFSQLLAAGDIRAVDEQTDRDMYLAAIEILTNAGFAHYEISNFAKQGAQCKHNLAYWNNTDYIGIGAAAGSFHNKVRSENIADINGYIDAVEKGLPPKQYTKLTTGQEYAGQTAVLMLRKRDGLAIDEFAAQTGLNPLEIFAAQIQSNISKNMLKMDNGRIYLTHAALPIADSVLCDFVL